METLPVPSRRPGDGLHRPPEPAILSYYSSLEPRTDPMGSVAGQYQIKTSVPAQQQWGQVWCIKSAAGVPPWGGCYASRTDYFETGTSWSFTLPQKGPNSGQPCGREKANKKPAQSKKTTTKCDSPNKRFQDGSRTLQLRLKGLHHTSPKIDVSRYRNWNRTA